MAEGLDKPLLQCGSRESLLSTTSVATSVRTMPFPGPMKSDSDVSSCPPLTMGQLQRLKTLRSSPPDKHTGAASLCGTPSWSRSSLVSPPQRKPESPPLLQQCKHAKGKWQPNSSLMFCNWEDHVPVIKKIEAVATPTRHNGKQNDTRLNPYLSQVSSSCLQLHTLR